MLDRLIDLLAERIADKLSEKNGRVVVERVEQHVHYPPTATTTWPRQPGTWPPGTITS